MELQDQNVCLCFKCNFIAFVKTQVQESGRYSGTGLASQLLGRLRQEEGLSPEVETSLDNTTAHPHFLSRKI